MMTPQPDGYNRVAATGHDRLIEPIRVELREDHPMWKMVVQAIERHRAALRDCDEPNDPGYLLPRATLIIDGVAQSFQLFTVEEQSMAHRGQMRTVCQFDPRGDAYVVMAQRTRPIDRTYEVGL